MSWDRPKHPAAEVKLEKYVREWATEDVGRYERVSGRKVGASEGSERWDSKQGKHVRDPGTPNTVVTVVLEVPATETQHVTNLLRNSTPAPVIDGSGGSLRPGYLVQAARHAEQQLPVLDQHVGLLETRLRAVERLAFEMAAKLDSAHVDCWPYIDGHGVSHRNSTWHEYVEHTMGSMARANFDSINHAFDQMRQAVTERKSEVAATLLAKMEDEDGLGR